MQSLPAPAPLLSTLLGGGFVLSVPIHTGCYSESHTNSLRTPSHYRTTLADLSLHVELCLPCKGAQCLHVCSVVTAEGRLTHTRELHSRDRLQAPYLSPSREP